MTTTLAQVARLAGVSDITASRALRGSDSVSPKTIRKVLDAANTIGYVPNRVAGSLAGSRSNQVGVVLPSLSNIVFPDVLKGLEDQLELAGFHPILGVSHYDAEREEKLIRSLLSWRPAGIVVAPTSLSDGSRRMLRDATLPVVEIMDIVANPIDVTVGISHRDAGRQMAQYLCGRGYDSFGYVGHDISSDRRAMTRLDGFREGLAQSGHVLKQTILLDHNSSVGLGRAGLAQLTAAGDCPRVVYFSNDDMAVGAVFQCLAEGLTVPDDIAIVGFNGLEVGQSLPRPLTTMSSNREEIGRAAAKQILLRLDGKATTQKVDVGITLIPGATA